MTNLLICDGKEFKVPKKRLIDLNLFEESPELMKTPYVIKSTRNVAAVQDFLRALMDEQIEINSENAVSLDSLCQELGFEALQERIGSYLAAHPEIGHGIELKRLQRIVAQQGRVIESLKSEIAVLLNGDLRREMVSIRSELEELKRAVSDEVVSLRQEMRTFELERSN